MQIATTTSAFCPSERFAEIMLIAQMQAAFVSGPDPCICIFAP